MTLEEFKNLSTEEKTKINTAEKHLFFLEEIYNRTQEPVLSAGVFNGTLNNKTVRLTFEFNVSNIFGRGLLIQIGLLKKVESDKSGFYIQWIGERPDVKMVKRIFLERSNINKNKRDVKIEKKMKNNDNLPSIREVLKKERCRAIYLMLQALMINCPIDGDYKTYDEAFILSLPNEDGLMSEKNTITNLQVNTVLLEKYGFVTLIGNRPHRKIKYALDREVTIDDAVFLDDKVAENKKWGKERLETKRIEAEKVETKRIEAEKVEAERIEVERLMVEKSNEKILPNAVVAISVNDDDIKDEPYITNNDLAKLINDYHKENNDKMKTLINLVFENMNLSTPATEKLIQEIKNNGKEE